MTQTASDDTFVVHFLGPLTITTSASIHGCGRVMEYGMELPITPQLRQIVTQLSQTWLDLVDDEEGQVKRWGKVMFRRGPWPEGVSRLLPGSFE